MNINDKINEYLWYGFLLPDSMPQWLINLSDTMNQNHNEHNLKSFSIMLDEIFDDLLGKSIHDHHIVFLSGGWDSRLILAELLKRVDKSKINTLSFGQPGQLDYEIGLDLAKSFQLRSTAIDLGNIELNWEIVCKACQKIPWSSYPDNLFNYIIRERISNLNTNVWSGFLGDPLAGSHLPAKVNSRLEELKEFKKKHKKNSSLFVDKKYNPDASIPDLIKDINILYTDQLDLGIRQSKLIAPIVLPLSKFEGWTSNSIAKFGQNTYWAPFVHPKWASYWLSAPYEKRVALDLFLKGFKYKHSDIYNFPAKATWGASPSNPLSIGWNYGKTAIEALYRRTKPYLSRRPFKNQNYLDMANEYRTNKQHIEILNNAIDFLDHEKVLSVSMIKGMVDKHLNNKGNYSDIFSMLIGLAANLKVNN